LSRFESFELALALADLGSASAPRGATSSGVLVLAQPWYDGARSGRRASTRELDLGDELRLDPHDRSLRTRGIFGTSRKARLRAQRLQLAEQPAISASLKPVPTLPTYRSSRLVDAEDERAEASTRAARPCV
jgi:hypothetical protein